VFFFCDGPITQTHTLWMHAHNYQQVPPQIASYMKFYKIIYIYIYT
jgi:hypothetical protein